MSSHPAEPIPHTTHAQHACRVSESRPGDLPTGPGLSLSFLCPSNFSLSLSLFFLSPGSSFSSFILVFFFLLLLSCSTSSLSLCVFTLFTLYSVPCSTLYLPLIRAAVNLRLKITSPPTRSASQRASFTSKQSVRACLSETILSAIVRIGFGGSFFFFSFLCPVFQSLDISLPSSPPHQMQGWVAPQTISLSIE